MLLKYKTVIIFIVALLLLFSICISISNNTNELSFEINCLNAVMLVLQYTAIVLLLITIFYVLPIWCVRKFGLIRINSSLKMGSQKAKALHKFISNTNAMCGAFTIVYMVILFIFAHIIAPDKTPFANDQINELSFKEPGFSIRLLTVPAERSAEKSTLFKWLIYGKKRNDRLIPINNYFFKADSIYVERYLGEGINGQIIGFKNSAFVQSSESTSIQQVLIKKKFIQSRTFIFGTDDLGRDYLSRILIGVRVSLSVGFVAVIIALFIGIPIGAFAGFYQKEPPQFKKIKIPIDGLLMWLMSIIWSIPTILIVFPIVFAFGQQFYTIFIAVGLTMWVDIARLVRGQVLQVRKMEFVEATKSFGFSSFRTIFRHILPNITGPIIVITAANFAYAILTEAGLSFLGIGVQAPAPSWGLMISKYKDNLITNPYLALIPGFAITLLVLAIFMIGNGLRDALDVKSKIEF